jgi:hypothetical protein
MADGNYQEGGGVTALYMEKFDFNVWLQEQAKSTPWWIISIAAHALMVMVFMAITFSEENIDLNKAGEVNYNIADAPPVDNEKPPEQELDLEDDTEKEILEKPIVRPYAEEDVKNESNDNEEYEKMKGDSENMLSDSPLKGNGVYDTIGVGGGAGGRYGGRLGGKRDRVARGGGSKETESAVLAGLRWLARHQSPDGGWDADSFKNQCKDTICEGAGFGEYDAGVTGLSMLAFLGAGYTHTSRETFEYGGKKYCFGTIVKDGLRWMIKNQDAEGCIGSRNGGKFMYNHCIGALAMSEAYGITGSGLFKDPAQKGIQFLLAAQNPYKAWRYQVRPGDNDTSVTGWAVMALKSADISGLEMGKAGYEGAKAWLDEVTDDTYYKVGYTAKGSGKVVVPNKNDTWGHHEALTAVGMMCRIFIDKDKTDPRLKGGAELLLQDLPSWDNSKADDKKVDFYYWYYASLALFQYDGPDGKFWKGWNEAMKTALVPNQKTKKDKCADGSWDSNEVDRWGFEGGRVYSTAINTLTLEIYYRYDSVFGTEKRGTAK